MSILGAVFLAGCAASSSPGGTVEKYLQALADKDETAAVSLSCAEWEEQALAEGASFKNVSVELQNVDCQAKSQSEGSALVTCTGKYVFSYDAGEDQELDLEGREFKVVQEASEWRMCGYPE